MAVTYRYEVYDGGGLSGDEAHFCSAPFTTPRIERTSGGVLVTTDPIAYMVDPNALPEEKVSGQLGLTPSIVSGEVINGALFAPANRDWPESPLDHADVQYVTTRFFLMKFRLKVEWSDGTALKGRAINLNSRVYDFGLPNPSAPWTVPSVSSAIYSTRFEAGLGELNFVNYQLTDGSGIAEYYLMVGIATGISHDDALFYWNFEKPPTLYFSPLIVTQNFEMSVSDAEVLSRKINEDHRYYQLAGDSLTENTPGWAVDYSTAGGGLLSYTNPPLVTHTYHQWGQIRIFGDDGAEINANVSFGSFSGVTGDLIEAVPKGSLLDDVRDRLDDPPASPILTQIPLLSGSGYASSATTKETRIELVTQYSGAHVDTRYTGKSGNILTGVTFPEEIGLIRHSAFAGGEVVTEGYDGTWTEIGGSGRSGTFRIYIHEDQIATNEPPGSVNSSDTVSLDIDRMGNRWAVFVPTSGDHAGKVTLARQLGCATTWEYFEIGDGAEPWIHLRETDADFTIFVAYRSGSDIVLASNRDNGHGSWTLATIASGTNPFPRFLKGPDILFLTYCRDGKVYLKRTCDEGATFMKWLDGSEEKEVMALATPETPAFDFTRDALCSLLLLYSDGTDVKTLKSNDNGESWS